MRLRVLLLPISRDGVVDSGNNGFPLLVTRRMSLPALAMEKNQCDRQTSWLWGYAERWGCCELKTTSKIGSHNIDLHEQIRESKVLVGDILAMHEMLMAHGPIYALSSR